MEEQFNVGMSNIVNLLSAKDNLLASQQEVLQAKYMAVYNANMLRFYKGELLN